MRKQEQTVKTCWLSAFLKESTARDRKRKCGSDTTLQDYLPHLYQAGKIYVVVDTTENVELLYQHVTDIVFENMLLPTLCTAASSSEASSLSTSTTQLSYREKNALQFASGCIISKLKKKISKSKCVLKNDLLIGLDDLLRKEVTIYLPTGPPWWTIENN